MTKDCIFPLTESKEKAHAFFNLIVEELNTFKNTKEEIPKERQLEFHIARIIQKAIDEKKCYENIFMCLGAGFNTKDVIDQKEINPRNRIDISLFYYPENCSLQDIDQYEKDFFSEVIEIKRSGNIPGKDKRSDKEYKIILDKYFNEEFYQSGETNTIAHDFRRLVNFIAGPTKHFRIKYKGEFKKTHSIMGGLFIDLYNEELKKTVIEHGTVFWNEKKKELKKVNDYYIYTISQMLKNQSKNDTEYLSIAFFTKKKISDTPLFLANK